MKIIKKFLIFKFQLLNLIIYSSKFVIIHLDKILFNFIFNHNFLKNFTNMFAFEFKILSNLKFRYIFFLFNHLSSYIRRITINFDSNISNILMNY